MTGPAPSVRGRTCCLCIQFENRQCGLRAQKILLREGGIIASDKTRAPFGPVSPRTRRGLVELAAARDLLVTRWAR